METVAEDGSEREVSDRLPDQEVSEAYEKFETPNNNVEGSEVRATPIDYEQDERMDELRR